MDFKRTSSKNILIADDDALIRWQLGKIVRNCGGEIVFSAESVEDVEQNDSLDFENIDMAIVDYEFGSEKTGIDLIRSLKSKGVERIYLCTGYYENEEIRLQACIAGADSILSKPIDEDKLKTLLK